MKALRLVAASLAFGFIGLGTLPASAQEVAPRRTVRPNRPLLVTGAAIIAASYTPAVAIAATSDRPADKWLYVPVAGPWLDLANRGSECGPGGCPNEGVNKALLITTGVAHLVGVGAVVASLFVPESSNALSGSITSTKPTVVPAQLGAGGYGVAVFGRF